MVKRYSFKKDGNKALSAHFKVREFRSKDGCDTILIADELVTMLEALYGYLGASAINLSSGYRTAAHDKAVGGNGHGQHTLGKAADLCVKGKNGKLISGKTICCAAQTLGFHGIGYIGGNYVHVDCRDGHWWGDETKPVSSASYQHIDDFYTYFGVTKPTTSVSAVTTANLRLRRLPSLSGEVCRTLKKGTAVRYNPSGARQADGYRWVPLESGGWVADAYLKRS